MSKTSILIWLLFLANSYGLDTLLLSDSSFNFSLVIANKNEFRSEIKEVIITSRLSKTVIQHLMLPPNIGFIPAFSPTDYLPDVNFDGYSDISILEVCGAGPNCGNLFYVYDIKSNSFIRDSILETIPSAEFLPKTKTIRSFLASGCCYHGENIYKYYNNKIICVVEKKCEPFTGTKNTDYVSTVYKMKKGKMVLVKKRYLTREYVCTIGFGW